MFIRARVFATLSGAFAVASLALPWCVVVVRARIDWGADDACVMNARVKRGGGRMSSSSHG